MNQQWSCYIQRLVTVTVNLAVMMLLMACGSGYSSRPTVASGPTIEATVMVITARGITDKGDKVSFVAPHNDGDRKEFIIANLADFYKPQTLIIFVTAITDFVQVTQVTAGMTVHLTAEVHLADTSESVSSTAETSKNNPGAINDELEATQISPPNSNDPNGGVVIYRGQTTQDVSADKRLHFKVGPNLSYDFAIDPKVLSTSQSFKSGQFVNVSVVFTNSQGERCSYSDTGCTGTVESAST